MGLPQRSQIDIRADCMVFIPVTIFVIVGVAAHSFLARVAMDRTLISAT